ncbi:MAG TPA: DUF4255 domain-containing protein, partial [Thermomicrobiales bacterium]|nr:DUF4255 domain-containing protein [Thermomicrobiales bacterium]
QYQPEDFEDNQLEFKVYVAKDFATPMDAGVSAFLYRIYPNGSHRTPSGRLDPFGRRYRTQLPLDLHFLLTAWAKDASLQHTIAGWMMRVLEDTPSFPPGLLNSTFDNVFHPDETVEIGLTELSTEELFRIWEVIGEKAYQLSIPYVARTVRIESRLPSGDGEPVQERVFRAGLVSMPGGG